mmetsp:Transcript_77795/g.174399  ORF Transcript_77795/g.174399 Transcript_77795/m.174399 type:complete len:210 (+) Transcript_77795:1454-2083(+)
MLLSMVVVRLHHVQYLVVFAQLLAECGAVVPLLQLDDPNALARGTAVLLDDTRLKLHSLLETCCEILLRVVGQGIFKTDVEIGNLAQGVFRAHVLHNIRGRPHLNAQLTDFAHAVVELPLVTSISLDLTRVAPDDDKVKILADFKKLFVFLVDIMNQLAAHTGLDHTVRERDGIIAVAIATLVGATIGGASYVDLAKGPLELGRGRLLQ